LEKTETKEKFAEGNKIPKRKKNRAPKTTWGEKISQKRNVHVGKREQYWEKQASSSLVGLFPVSRGKTTDVKRRWRLGTTGREGEYCAKSS